MKKESIVRVFIFVLLILASLVPYYCGTTRDEDNTRDTKSKDIVSKDVTGLEDIEVTDGGYSVVTVYQIQSGKVPEKTLVEVRDVVVTSPTFKSSSKSADNDSFFVVEKDGGPYSGIYVFYKNNKADVAIGDVVDIRGTYMEYYNNSQIVATEVIKKGTSPLPAPIEVDPAKVKTGGEDSEKYEGCFIRVLNVEVTNEAVLGTDGKPHGDFEVTGGLIVGKLFPRNYRAKNGDKIDSISGILNYSFDQMRLQPRGDNDITIGSLADGGTDVIGGDTEVITGITVYDIQDINSPAHPSENSAVRIENVVVTGGQFNASLNYYGIFVQEKTGGPYSGILVVYNKTSGLGPFMEGDVVTIEGTYKEFYDMSEIVATSITKTGSGEVIKPEVVNPADVATGGADSEKYEGVLIKVENVEVIDANPDASSGKDYKEFMVTGNLRVNDKYSYSYTNNRKVGDKFDYIIGILDYDFGNFKLNPRSDEDLALAGSIKPDAGQETDTNITDTGNTDAENTDTPQMEGLKIYDIQDVNSPKHPSENSIVKVENVVVTGGQFSVSSTLYGMFVQEKTGGPYSGILVVYNKTSGLGPFMEGDVVTIEGTYKEFYDMSEIVATSITKTGSGEVIKPEVVNPADVATGGADSEKYEGVLIKVENVEVIDANPDASSGKDYKEFMVTGNLRVNDKYSYSYTNNRKVGDKFDYIIGILDYDFGNFKLNPRSDEDISLKQ